ncbi:MAG: nuclear transport factor 2 family protein [Pyrinomonadaceae bacterium]
MQRIFIRIIFVAFFIAFIGGAYAKAQSKTFSVTFPPRERVWIPEFQDKPERTFEQLEHKLSDATRSANKAALGKLLGEKLMILGLPHSKAQWIELVVSGKGTFVSVEKSVARIQILGDTVIVTGMQYVDSKTSNGGSSYQFGFMNTWVRSKKGEWTCVALASDQVKARN